MPRLPGRHRNARALVAIARDEATAEAWQGLLADAGIEAQVRIDSPERAGMPGRVSFPLGYAQPGLSLFSYPLYVHPRDRRAARAVLRRKAELGAAPVDRTMVIGAVAVVAASMALVLLLLLRA